MSNFKIIEPAATTNLCTNPSFEKDSTGWSTPGTNTITRSATQSRSGNYSLKCTYQDSTDLARFNNITLPTASTDYKLTARLYVPANWDGGDIAFTHSSFTGASAVNVSIYTDGTSPTREWVHLERTLTLDTDVTGNIIVFTSSAPTAGRFVYLDAVQFEETSTVTTYCDGDQPGCFWTGAEHGSTSTRLVTSRAGGVVKDFDDDFSFPVDTIIGAGMPPVGNITVGRAQLPGTEHQRTKIGERVFSLVSDVIGTSLSNLHSLRQSLITLLSSDAVPDEQPFVIQYEGAATDKRIEAHYMGGLDLTFGAEQGFTERIGLQFLASDPLWYGLGDEKVDLSPTSATISYIVGRERGTWNVMGPPSSGSNVYDIVVAHEKLIYVCGTFTNWDGTAQADAITYWDGSAWNALGTPDTGTASITNILDMSLGPDNTLYVVGNFLNLAGNTDADWVAQWEGGSAWAEVSSTPDTGTASISNMQAVLYATDGNLYVGGTFTDFANISNADNIAYWDGSSWNAMTTGTDTTVNAIAGSVISGLVYVGGSFTTAGGSTVNNFAEWDNGAWVGYNGGFNGTVHAIVESPNGTVYAGGSFTQTDGGDTLNRIAKWNGTAWEPLGTGVNDVVRSMSFDSDGLLYVGGDFTAAGGIAIAGNVAAWDGSTWRAIPLDLPGAPVVRALATGGIDNIYVGFNTTGTGYYSQPTTATNSGSATAYPIITIKRDGGSGTITLEEIVNITTGRRLLFNRDVLDGEEITIDLRPGKRSMTSNFSAGFETSIKQTSWNGLLASSDITSFNLLPGTNTMAVYTSPSAPSELSVFVRWVPAFWSLD